MKYLIENNALYRIRYVAKLCKILKIEKDNLLSLVESEDLSCYYYQVYDSCDREIYKPEGVLYAIHKRINFLLNLTQRPNYLHSGRKGFSYITNAKQHIGHSQVLILDIQSYFSSISRIQVFKLFRNQFNCSHKISDLLAHLCTFQNCLVTGSPVSMTLAFLCTQEMFNELHKMAEKEKITMTVYVDDITFSGKKISSSFQYRAKGILHRYGFNINKDKTRFYKRKKTKREITGIAIKENKVTVSDKTFQKLHEELTNWKKIIQEQQDYSIKYRKDSLVGLLYHVAQFEPQYYQVIKRVGNEYVQYAKNFARET